MAWPLIPIFETLFPDLWRSAQSLRLWQHFPGFLQHGPSNEGDLPARATWARLLALPYSIPGYLIGMAAIAAANQIGAVYGFWGYGTSRVRSGLCLSIS